MNPSTTTSKMFVRYDISPQDAAQIHWDSIVDVCCGRAKSLTEAKAARTQSIVVPVADVRRAEALGLAPALIPSFASDAATLRMMECINLGGKWGDIWYDDTRSKLKSVEAEIAAIRTSGTPGRWREAVPLYPLQDSLRRELGMSVST